MFGTWQPTSRERSLTLCSPEASRSTTQSRFGSARARATAAAPQRAASSMSTVSIGVIMSLLAQPRKSGRARVVLSYAAAVSNCGERETSVARAAAKRPTPAATNRMAKAG